jgi:CRISPR-associated protein Csh1
LDVALTLLRPLLHRPGGKKAKSHNESRRLFDLRRDIAEAVYHERPIPIGRFWDEIAKTARLHWDAACATDRPVYQLLYEGWSAKKKEPFLTLAGWVRQLARFLHYCRLIGVLPMPDPDRHYQPGAEVLKPYFGPESAIDSRAKAFAFILGALYGKLLQVQAARDVNVGANALTWLKRLTLAGTDLPELYVKVREKLMVYGTEGNATVRELVAELGELGTRLGTDIELDETQTCYFLLLGQSLAVKILPSKDATGEDRHD